MDLCQIDVERCKGCGLCVKFCPQGALEMSPERNSKGYEPAHLVHPELCNGCALCAQMCTDVAITVYRRMNLRASKRIA